MSKTITPTCPHCRGTAVTRFHGLKLAGTIVFLTGLTLAAAVMVVAVYASDPGIRQQAQTVGLFAQPALWAFLLTAAGLWYGAATIRCDGCGYRWRQ